MPRPNPIPAGIQIHWIESEVITIKIQFQPGPLSAASSARERNQNCRPGLAGQCPVKSEARKLAVVKPRRQAS